MTRLLVVDAPGGPRPEQYLPSLCAEFDVTVVWLAVEPQAARERRRAAVAVADRTVAVPDPAKVAEAVRREAAETPPAGVVAFSERVVHIAQRVAWDLGLPANRPETLRALQRKDVQRQLLTRSGLLGPHPWLLRTERDCADAAAHAKFPAVLKPSVGMGSIATFRVPAPEDLLPIWRQAAALIATDSRVAHHSPVLVLEAQLTGIDPVDEPGLGDYVSVEVLVTRRGPQVLAVSDKLPLSPPFRENAHILPSIRTPEALAPVVECVLSAHSALDVTHGVTHTEVKLTPDGPAIIEVNGRVGGGVTEELRLAADYDLPLELARTATGADAVAEPRFRRYASFLTPQPPEGRHVVHRSPRQADLRRAFPALDEITHITAAGQIADSAVGTSSNLLKAFAAAPSHRDLVELASHVTDSFHLDPVACEEEEETA